MTSSFCVYSNAVVMATSILFVVQGDTFGGPKLKIANACYGTVNNYLRLDCGDHQRISVHKVLHGAKLKTDECSTPASVDTYNKGCCQLKPSDCNFIVPFPAAATCENRTSCRVIATWSTTNTECDQDLYPPNTHYMLMAYDCISDRSIEAPFPDDGQFVSTVATPEEKTIDSGDNSSRLPTSSHPSIVTEIDLQPIPGDIPRAGEQHGDSEQLSDAMIGAIVGGSLGMVLTLTVFLFYWGRKRRHLRIEGKHPPSVWDYLLNQTFTVRGSRGYDQFPSGRSSVSSDGDQHSPVVRKNLWLPNIAPQNTTSPPLDPDVLSNFENESTISLHRVELYPSATPAPYATLSLEPSSLDTNPPHQHTNHHHHHLHEHEQHHHNIDHHQSHHDV